MRGEKKNIFEYVWVLRRVKMFKRDNLPQEKDTFLIPNWCELVFFFFKLASFSAWKRNNFQTAEES